MLFIERLQFQKPLGYVEEIKRIKKEAVGLEDQHVYDVQVAKINELFTAAYNRNNNRFECIMEKLKSPN